jgi:hypothetical protein
VAIYGKKLIKTITLFMAPLKVKKNGKERMKWNFEPNFVCG